MFKQALKYTVLALLWRRYRQLIIATALLFLYFWLVGRLHEDFVAYLALKQSQDFLGLSFFAKWLLLALGGGLWGLFLCYWRRPAGDTSTAPSPDKVTRETQEPPSPKLDSLRGKVALRSLGDTIIERYPQKTGPSTGSASSGDAASAKHKSD